MCWLGTMRHSTVCFHSALMLSYGEGTRAHAMHACPVPTDSEKKLVLPQSLTQLSAVVTSIQYILYIGETSKSTRFYEKKHVFLFIFLLVYNRADERWLGRVRFRNCPSDTDRPPEETTYPVPGLTIRGGCLLWRQFGSDYVFLVVFGFSILILVFWFWCFGFGILVLIFLF